MQVSALECWCVRVERREQDQDKSAAAATARVCTRMHPWRTAVWSEHDSMIGSSKGLYFCRNRKGGSPEGCRCSCSTLKRVMAAGIKERALLAELKTGTQ